MNSVILKTCAGVVLAGCVAAPVHAEARWQLVWSDEFDAPRIDRAKWNFDVDCWGGGNNERQCYTRSERNASIEDGKLVITARRERASGKALPLILRQGASDPNAEVTREFTSARLSTRGKAAWRFGRIEVHAKLPQGQGVWPAIWMLPEKDIYGGWAASGEIDILEAVNLGVPCAECPSGVESNILATLQFGGAWPQNSYASTENSHPEVLEGFHTYAVVWKPGSIVWQIDGSTYAARQSSEWSTTGSEEPGAPFDQAFHLILNLAIGGNLPEQRGLGGVTLNGFPKRMEIDWVRVWQEAEGATSERSEKANAGGN